MTTTAKKEPVSTAMARAKGAFAEGRLEQYKPLEVSGNEEVKSTCAASWGPAMRR